MLAKTIGLLAAMPDETRPLLKRVGAVVRDRAGRFRCHRFETGGAGVCLVESGMGMELAAAAAAELAAALSPAAVVSFGFGGAVLPGLAVGDVVVGTDSWLYDTCGFLPQEGISRGLAGEVVLGLGGKGIRVVPGEIITSRRILAKAALAPALPPGMSNPVLDMETAAVAAVMARHGIPLVALRGVSDGAEEELAFSLDEFTDSEMRIRPAKVLVTIARKPWIVPQLARLARNTRVAGVSLAAAVTATVELLASRSR